MDPFNPVSVVQPIVKKIPQSYFSTEQTSPFIQEALHYLQQMKANDQELNALTHRVEAITNNVAYIVQECDAQDRNLAVLVTKIKATQGEVDSLQKAADVLTELQKVRIAFEKAPDGSIEIVLSLAGIGIAVYITPMTPLFGTTVLSGAIRALFSALNKKEETTPADFFKEFTFGFMTSLATAGITNATALPAIKLVGNEFACKLFGKITSDTLISIAEKKSTGKEIKIKDVAVRALGVMLGDLAASGLPELMGEAQGTADQVLQAAASGAARNGTKRLVTNLCTCKTFTNGLLGDVALGAALEAVQEARQIQYDKSTQANASTEPKAKIDFEEIKNTIKEIMGASNNRPELIEMHGGLKKKAGKAWKKTRKIFHRFWKNVNKDTPGKAPPTPPKPATTPSTTPAQTPSATPSATPATTQSIKNSKTSSHALKYLTGFSAVSALTLYFIKKKRAHGRIAPPAPIAPIAPAAVVPPALPVVNAMPAPVIPPAPAIQIAPPAPPVVPPAPLAPPAPIMQIAPGQVVAAQNLLNLQRLYAACPKGKKFRGRRERLAMQIRGLTP